jgi:hypothetical protein
VLCYGFFSIYSSHLNLYFCGGFNEISCLCLPGEGLECELLQIGGQKWLVGNLKILINVRLKTPDTNLMTELKKNQYRHLDSNSIRSFSNSLQLNPEDFFNIQMSLEFYAEKDELMVNNLCNSPLDEIRQMSVE